MCDLYEIILIIIIISLGQLLLSYIANTSRMHARTHACKHTRARAHTHTHRHRRSGCRCSMGRWRPTVTELRPFKLVPLAINGRSLLHSNKHWRGRPGFSELLGVFSHMTKLLGRTETRTRDRMYCQTIRTVRDISRYDRARIATAQFANVDRQT